MAGDYVILKVFLGKYVTPEVVAAHLKPLLAHKRVYAVLGNHDWWKNGTRVRRALESIGVIVLENQATEVTLGQMPAVAGRRRRPVGRPSGHASRIRRRSTTTRRSSRSPTTRTSFPQMPARASLVIAGHTHGGQVNLLPGQPSMRFGHYIAGPIFDHGRQLFVTPGIGTSILPFRFRVPPEISRLTLRAAK